MALHNVDGDGVPFATSCFGDRPGDPRDIMVCYTPEQLPVLATVGGGPDPRYADTWAIDQARALGYGGAANLARLLRGTIPEYRDNYTAGHALWVFLTRWRGRDGGRPFLPQVAPYLASFAQPDADPVRTFSGLFADGSGGRPKGLDAFARVFADFLDGFRARRVPTPEDDEVPPWVREYVRRAAPYAQDRLDDLPAPETCRRRTRAPPVGAGIAARAGHLLAAGGRADAAVAAFEWARDIDDARAEDDDPPIEWSALEGRAVAGMPRSTAGTLCFRLDAAGVPDTPEGRSLCVRQLCDTLEDWGRRLARRRLQPTVVLLLPRCLPPESVRRVEESVGDALGPEMEVRLHGGETPPAGPAWSLDDALHVILLDPRGTVRVAEPARGAMLGTHAPLGEWLAVFGRR